MQEEVDEEALWGRPGYPVDLFQLAQLSRVSVHERCHVNSGTGLTKRG
jgi:hypothetical protein